MITDTVKQFVKNALIDIVEDMSATEETFAKYFSPDYIQLVDGKTFDYSTLVKHMKTQKAVLQSAKITFKYLIAEGNKVSSVHIVDAIKKDGSSIKAQVNALIIIENNKIILCDELTYLIKGSKADQDLGSRC